MRPAGNTFVAVYPDNGVEYDPAGAFVTMPSVQTFAEGTFATSSNPMVAHTDDPENLYFTNLCGLIELQITGSTTLSSIELHSKDNFLCGRGQVFLTANKDYLLSFAGGGQKSLRMENIGKALTVEHPTSIFMVVPCGNYSGLEVVMTDNQGNRTTRTASTDILVVRSHIAPLKGLNMENSQTQPAVTIDVSPVEDDPFLTHVAFTMDKTRCDTFYYAAVDKNRFDEILAANPDLTVQDYILSRGTQATESFQANYRINPETEAIFFALPLKEGSVVHDPVRFDYTTLAIAIDPALGAQITVTPGENDITASVLATGTPVEILYRIFNRALFDQFASDPTVLFHETFLQGVRAEFSGNPTVITSDGLFPGMEYALCVVLRSQTGYTPVLWTFFTTPEHQASAATITFTPGEVRDYTATFDVSLHEGSTYTYEVLPGRADLYDLTMMPGELSMFATMFSGPIVSIGDLRPETVYTIFGIAYDDQGVYGELSYLTFTTQSPIPGRDSEEYRRMIGTWRMEYDNLIGSETPALTVTISEEAVGNTYLVSGLLSQASRDATGIDDTVRARFVDGEIVLESGTPVANSGSLSEKNVVQLVLINANTQYWPQDWQLRGSYDSDGSIRFSGAPAEVVSYIISYYSYDGMMPIEPLAPTNIKLVKVGAGQTEGFQYDTPWNPGWK